MGKIEPNYEESSPAALGAGRDLFAIEVLDRIKKAEKEMDLMKDLFRDAYDYGYPTRPDFDNTSVGERRTDMIFDETLVVAIPEFASELQSGLIPAQSEIFRLMAGSSIPPEKRGMIQAELDEITDFIHGKLRESNFSEETHECLMDIAIGTMNMTSTIVSPLNKLEFSAVPLHEVALDCGPDGKPDLKIKCHKVENKKIKARFPNAEISPAQERAIKNNPDVKVQVYEGVFRKWSEPDEVYCYFVINKETKETLVRKETKGRGSNPWISARWSANSGEVFGRGLVLNVMPTVKSLNLVLQLIFENAQVAIGGIWQYDADGTINPDTIILEPGTFIPRAPGSKIDPMQSPTQFDVAQFVINDARAAIRKGMLVDTLDQEGKTPASALQVGQEMGKFARRMGASYNRLLNEFVFEVVHRVIYLYTQRGIISMPKIDGEIVEIIAVSPLARAQQSQDVTDFTRFVEVSNFTYGPEATQMALKQIEGMQWLADKMNVDKKLIKSMQEISEEVANAAQAMQQNPEMAGAMNGPAGQ